jgi:hypothetical protein
MPKEEHRERQKSDRVSEKYSESKRQQTKLRNSLCQPGIKLLLPLGVRKAEALLQCKPGSCHNRLADLALGQ